MNYQEFVNDYLIPLTAENNPDRAVLADLRRGLSDFPQLSPYMHRHVIPRLPDNLNRWSKLTYYLTAALFAVHQTPTDEGNFGAHFHKLLDPGNPDANTPIERRFTYLLAAHPEDLHFHLRQAVVFLKSKGSEAVPINWVQLMWDIYRWRDPDARATVQEHWANRFWQNRSTSEDNTPSESPTPETN